MRARIGLVVLGGLVACGGGGGGPEPATSQNAQALGDYPSGPLTQSLSALLGAGNRPFSAVGSTPAPTLINGLASPALENAIDEAMAAAGLQPMLGQDANIVAAAGTATSPFAPVCRSQLGPAIHVDNYPPLATTTFGVGGSLQSLHLADFDSCPFTSAGGFPIDTTAADGSATTSPVDLYLAKASAISAESWTSLGTARFDSDGDGVPETWTLSTAKMLLCSHLMTDVVFATKGSATTPNPYEEIYLLLKTSDNPAGGAAPFPGWIGYRGMIAEGVPMYTLPSSPPAPAGVDPTAVHQSSGPRAAVVQAYCNGPNCWDMSFTPVAGGFATIVGRSPRGAPETSALTASWWNGNPRDNTGDTTASCQRYLAMTAVKLNTNRKDIPIQGYSTNAERCASVGPVTTFNPAGVAEQPCDLFTPCDPADAANPEADCGFVSDKTITCNQGDLVTLSMGAPGDCATGIPLGRGPDNNILRACLGSFATTGSPTWCHAVDATVLGDPEGSLPHGGFDHCGSQKPGLTFTCPAPSGNDLITVVSVLKRNGGGTAFDDRWDAPGGGVGGEVGTKGAAIGESRPAFVSVLDPCPIGNQTGSTGQPAIAGQAADCGWQIYTVSTTSTTADSVPIPQPLTFLAAPGTGVSFDAGDGTVLTDTEEGFSSQRVAVRICDGNRACLWHDPEMIGHFYADNPTPFIAGLTGEFTVMVAWDNRTITDPLDVTLTPVMTAENKIRPSSTVDTGTTLDVASSGTLKNDFLLDLVVAGKVQDYSSAPLRACDSDTTNWGLPELEPESVTAGCSALDMSAATYGLKFGVNFDANSTFTRCPGDEPDLDAPSSKAIHAQLVTFRGLPGGTAWLVPVAGSKFDSDTGWRDVPVVWPELNPTSQDNNAHVAMCDVGNGPVPCLAVNGGDAQGSGADSDGTGAENPEVKGAFYERADHGTEFCVYTASLPSSASTVNGVVELAPSGPTGPALASLGDVGLDVQRSGTGPSSGAEFPLPPCFHLDGGHATEITIDLRKNVVGNYKCEAGETPTSAPTDCWCDDPATCLVSQSASGPLSFFQERNPPLGIGTHGLDFTDISVPVVPPPVLDEQPPCVRMLLGQACNSHLTGGVAATSASGRLFNYHPQAHECFELDPTNPSGETPVPCGTAHDEEALVPVSCSLGAPAQLPIGTNTIVCSATNEDGNTAPASLGTASLTVTVFDAVVAAHSDVTVESCSGTTVQYPTGVFTYDPTGAHQTRTCSATPPPEPSDSASFPAQVDCTCAGAVNGPCPPGAHFPIGTTTVSCTVDDSTFPRNASFTVTDTCSTPPPTLTLGGLPLDGSIRVTAEATGPTTVVSYAVVASDGSPVTCVPPSNSGFALGTTTVTCSATDAFGRTATGSFGVSIRDTTPPVITVPANIAQVASAANGNLVTFTATAADKVDGSRPVTCTPPSGSRFAPGVTTVTCSASDTHGNVSHASFTVTITFSFCGFDLPLFNPPLLSAVAVPVQFRLCGASAGITNLTATLWIARYASNVLGAEQAATPGLGYTANHFLFVAQLSPHYHYDWATRTWGAGSYRMRIDLGDGVLHAEDVTLK